VDINIFQSKSAAFMWELMFTRSMYGTPDIQAQGDLLNEISRLLDEGTIRTTKTQNCGTLNTVNLSAAHELIETGRTIGKIVLSGIAV
jgi:NADPH:quinone reductase-like Zn-dependent oxidoreductase